MAEFVIDANTFGAFYQNVGNNGEDDIVTVNIGPGFSGTITVDSQPADGEIDRTVVNLPDGWSLQVDNLNEEPGEDPSFKDWSYEVLNSDGIPVGTLSIRSNDIVGVPCLARGTLIETDRGLLPVEELAPGMMVATRDHGLQPVRWIGSVALDGLRLQRHPNLRPIRIRAGALGHGLPAANTLMSPQHRVLIRSRIVQRMFDVPEVLVAAKQLLGMDGIEVAEDVGEVEYHHILFDRHEVITANGMLTESLFTGAEALKSLSAAAREEIFTLFPDLGEAAPAPGARPFVRGHRARKMAARHRQNRIPLAARA